MADLVFYSNISANALGASNNELVSKGQSDTNSCSFGLSGISTWSAGSLSNAFGQLRIYNGLVYSCNQESLTASQGATTPDQSQYWDVCTFAQSATSTLPGLVKIGSGLSVSNGEISAFASRKSQKTISGGAITLDGTSVFKITPSSNTSFSFAAPDAPDCMQTFGLVVTFGSTVYDLVFPQSVSWSYCPSSFEANKTYVFQFSTFDSGESWCGVCLNGPQTSTNQNSIIFTLQVTNNTDVWFAYGEPFQSPITATWGDGSSEVFTTGDLQHTYITAGTYQVKFTSENGKMPTMFCPVELCSVDYADVEWYSESSLAGSGLLTVDDSFNGCENLTTIPATLFSRNSNIGSFAWCFKGCTSLESIPEELFGTNTSAVDFYSCFEGCSSLETIPSGLFSGFSDVSVFTSCFKNCDSLTTIPEGLFDDNTAATTFSGCFSGCSDLQAIPSGLFNENVLAADFSQCFAGCSSLTSVPSGLFNNVAANNSFYSCFSGCTSLTTVPTNLFDSITGADFRSVFGHCSSLVPSASSPYIPQVWEKDTAEFYLVEAGSYYSASAAARSYAPTTWGGTLGVYDPYYTYSSGDWCWYTVNGIPKVYTYINETSSSNHAPPDSNYWVYGYDLPSAATSVITFKKQKAGMGLNSYDLNYENGTYTITDDEPPISWTPGSFNSQTLSGTKISGSTNALMMSSWSLSGGVLRITLGAMASQMGLSNGTVLTFGGFVESGDSEWYYATSSTFS